MDTYLHHGGMHPGIAAEARADDHDIKARQPVLDGAHRPVHLLLLCLAVACIRESAGCNSTDNELETFRPKGI